MALTVARFAALLLAAVALGPSLAHLLALPNKIHLPAEEYLVVQQIYRGWALLGILLLAVLVATFVLTVMARDRPKAFAASLIAFLCFVAMLIVFFAFTYPANVQTQNWTVLPAHWESLRARWEYSHAANAVLNLIAVIALIWSVLVEQ